MKILIAEDDLTTLRILEAKLVKWGYEVVSAVNGKEAWEKLQGEDVPKLAVLDWMMPGMDGTEVCQKLRQVETSVPTYTILLTARKGKEDVVKGLQAGADDYIAKPFDLDELRARIEVGRRVVKLQTDLVEREKLQGVIEMAGAVCHELNQPLQVISGLVELLMMDVESDTSLYKNIRDIKEQINRMSVTTKKLMHVTKYKTKDHLDSKIIDIAKATH
jgi:DNA-binding response OmpR family regulator